MGYSVWGWLDRIVRLGRQIVNLTAQFYANPMRPLAHLPGHEPADRHVVPTKMPKK
jgi:hypothetical protein